MSEIDQLLKPQVGGTIMVNDHRRWVEVSEYYREDESKPFSHLSKRLKCKAIFHQFSVDYEELETGVGNFAVAIVEHENGNVEAVQVDLISFSV